MVFNRKEVFRHDFGSEGAVPASIAIKSAPVKAAAVNAAAAKTGAPKPGDSVQPQALQAAGATQEGQPAASTLTTAEAIAAELRAAQDAMPAPSNATFAPDCLNPANAVPTARRRAGANLGGFKTMAKGMFKS
jgi:hypothetical protein